jgi:hypothetical protein
MSDADGKLKYPKWLTLMFAAGLCAVACGVLMMVASLFWTALTVPSLALTIIGLLAVHETLER